VACLRVPRTKVFSSFLLFAWWPPLLFLLRIYFSRQVMGGIFANIPLIRHSFFQIICTTYRRIVITKYNRTAIYGFERPLYRFGLARPLQVPVQQRGIPTQNQWRAIV
jgi:hypothetical protein